MASILMRTVEACLDCLFPPRCVACRAFGAWWCLGCRSEVEQAGAGDLPDIPGVDGAVAFGLYHDPIMRAVVHGLKYRGGIALLDDVAVELGDWAWSRTMPWADEEGLALQSLVGAPRRIRERGFDQALALALAASASVAPDAALVDLLERRDGLAAQATVAHDLRAANVAGLFRLRRGVQVPESVLLVDDVITSGSTLAEAAKALKQAGVARVYGFALALGK